MGSLAVYTCNALLPLLSALILCIRNSKNAFDNPMIVGPGIASIVHCRQRPQSTRQWPVHAILMPALSDTGTLTI
jgi:hypothetical protein